MKNKIKILLIILTMFAVAVVMGLTHLPAWIDILTMMLSMATGGYHLWQNLSHI